jgi:hypothetical protein
MNGIKLIFILTILTMIRVHLDVLFVTMHEVCWNPNGHLVPMLIYVFMTRYIILDTSSGSSVSIVTRLRAGRPGFDSRQWKWREFSLRHRVQHCFRAHPTSYPMDTGGSFLGVKRPGHEDDHSPQHSAEVKNEWVELHLHPRYVFTAWCLVKHRDNFTLRYHPYICI